MTIFDITLFPQPLLIVFLFILGTSIGSFLNVLIDRLPQEKSLLGRSKCDFCHTQLQPLDLVPVISYIGLKGYSRCCRKKLSIQYPLIECATGLLFVFFGLYEFSFSLGLRFAVIAILCTFVVIIVADFKYHIIPDSMQIAFFVFSLVFLFLSQSLSNLNSLYQHLVWGVSVMIPILILFLITRGRGMGFGDVKLAFTMGFLLGFIDGLLALYIGFITGAVVGIVLLLSRQRRLKSKIAFGPFLILGTLVMFFFAPSIHSIFRALFNL